MADKHRVLVIGVGSIGERHLRCFLNTGRVDAAFVEVNETLRKTIAERYPAAKPHATLDAALVEKHDLAVICTPAPLHVPIARQLAELGVQLLIEKPLSTSLDGIAELIEIVERKKLAAGLAYVYRSHPVLTAMRAAIQSGRFGRPVQLVSTSGQHFPTYRPAYRTIYYTKREQGGGAIQDALTHMINAGEWLVGPINRLVVDAAHQVLEGVTVEDTVHLLARQGSVLASYAMNQYQAPNESSIMVVCENGTAEFVPHRNCWQWMTQPGGEWNVESFPAMERDTLFIGQANQFLDVVEGKAPILCPLGEGLQTLKVNLAALDSADHGGWREIK